MLPKISVVLPVWNGERYLREAIDSILAQTFSDFEFIVVDDGSVDDTRTILDSYSDGRLKVFHLEHGGIVAALNFGIAQARADWIARQDADDVSLPERLEQQWHALQRNPGAVLCFTDHSLLGESSGSLTSARLPRSRGFIALRLCYQSPFAHSTVLFSKESFLSADRYREAERHAEDYALWGRMLERGKFVAVPGKLLKFRRHPASVSRQNLDEQQALTFRIAEEHCTRFLSLKANDAKRAAEVLTKSSRERKTNDWLWFLSTCAPKLRWKSAEAFAWLAWQTVKQLMPD